MEVDENSEEIPHPQTSSSVWSKPTAKGDSIRSGALYPALSGEWEVPVTRNAKITGGGGAPPLRDHLWQGSPVTRNAEIDPAVNDPLPPPA